MEAGIQYRSRATSSPHFDYYYMPCARPKTSEKNTTSFSITRLRLPPRPDGACRCEPTSNPPQWKRTSQGSSRVREDTFKPARKQSIEEWVDEQVHLMDRSNYERRAPHPQQSMGKEELRQRMWDELVYEYEAEAQKWMHHEAEMRRRAQEREREEARRRIVQEDIQRIQSRVRERRDSERRAIAEERRRTVENAKEKVRREQARAEHAMLEAWNAYESRWAAISASSEPLGFRDIPWPLSTAPAKVADVTPEAISGFLLHPAHSSTHSRRERIRTALLRWHPDRFRRILNRVVDSEKGVVEEGVGVIARCLNELLAKEAKALQQMRGALDVKMLHTVLLSWSHPGRAISFSGGAGKLCRQGLDSVMKHSDVLTNTATCV